MAVVWRGRLLTLRYRAGTRAQADMATMMERRGIRMGMVEREMGGMSECSKDGGRQSGKGWCCGRQVIGVAELGWK